MGTLHRKHLHQGPDFVGGDQEKPAVGGHPEESFGSDDHLGEGGRGGCEDAEGNLGNFEFAVGDADPVLGGHPEHNNVAEQQDDVRVAEGQVMIGSI